jgi:hypothetical protein
MITFLTTWLTLHYKYEISGFISIIAMIIDIALLNIIYKLFNGA